jgi:hypothetical protein
VQVGVGLVPELADLAWPLVDPGLAGLGREQRAEHLPIGVKKPAGVRVRP